MFNGQPQVWTSVTQGADARLPDVVGVAHGRPGRRRGVEVLVGLRGAAAGGGHAVVASTHRRLEATRLLVVEVALGLEQHRGVGAAAVVDVLKRRGQVAGTLALACRLDDRDGIAGVGQEHVGGTRLGEDPTQPDGQAEVVAHIGEVVTVRAGVSLGAERDGRATPGAGREEHVEGRVQGHRDDLARGAAIGPLHELEGFEGRLHVQLAVGDDETVETVGLLPRGALHVGVTLTVTQVLQQGAQLTLLRGDHLAHAAADPAGQLPAEAGHVELGHGRGCGGLLLVGGRGGAAAGGQLVDHDPDQRLALGLAVAGAVGLDVLGPGLDHLGQVAPGAIVLLHRLQGIRGLHAVVGEDLEEVGVEVLGAHVQYSFCGVGRRRHGATQGRSAFLVVEQSAT